MGGDSVLRVAGLVLLMLAMGAHASDDDIDYSAPYVTLENGVLVTKYPVREHGAGDVPVPTGRDPAPDAATPAQEPVATTGDEARRSPMPLPRIIVLVAAVLLAALLARLLLLRRRRMT